MNGTENRLIGMLMILELEMKETPRFVMIDVSHNPSRIGQDKIVCRNPLPVIDSPGDIERV